MTTFKRSTRTLLLLVLATFTVGVALSMTSADAATDPPPVVYWDGEGPARDQVTDAGGQWVLFGDPLWAGHNDADDVVPGWNAHTVDRQREDIRLDRMNEAASPHTGAWHMYQYYEISQSTFERPWWNIDNENGTSTEGGGNCGYHYDTQDFKFFYVEQNDGISPGNSQGDPNATWGSLEQAILEVLAAPDDKVSGYAKERIRIFYERLAVQNIPDSAPVYSLCVRYDALRCPPESQRAGTLLPPQEGYPFERRRDFCNPPLDERTAEFAYESEIDGRDPRGRSETITGVHSYRVVIEKTSPELGETQWEDQQVVSRTEFGIAFDDMRNAATRCRNVKNKPECDTTGNNYDQWVEIFKGLARYSADNYSYGARNESLPYVDLEHQWDAKKDLTEGGVWTAKEYANYMSITFVDAKDRYMKRSVGTVTYYNMDGSVRETHTERGEWEPWNSEAMDREWVVVAPYETQMPIFEQKYQWIWARCNYDGMRDVRGGLRFHRAVSGYEDAGEPVPYAPDYSPQWHERYHVGLMSPLMRADQQDWWGTRDSRFPQTASKGFFDKVCPARAVNMRNETGISTPSAPNPKWWRDGQWNNYNIHQNSYEPAAGTPFHLQTDARVWKEPKTFVVSRWKGNDGNWVDVRAKQCDGTWSDNMFGNDVTGAITSDRREEFHTAYFAMEQGCFTNEIQVSSVWATNTVAPEVLAFGWIYTPFASAFAPQYWSFIQEDNGYARAKAGQHEQRMRTVTADSEIPVLIWSDASDDIRDASWEQMSRCTGSEAGLQCLEDGKMVFDVDAPEERWSYYPHLLDSRYYPFNFRRAVGE